MGGGGVAILGLKNKGGFQNLQDSGAVWISKKEKLSSGIG